MHRPQWIRFATFLVWLLAAASIVYWALQFVSGPSSPLSAAVAAPAAATIDAQALAKGLGGGAAPAASNPTEAGAAPGPLQAARFVLTGVVVQKSGASQGVALIAVDGKPPRPYRVGTNLTDGVVLHSVKAGKAMLTTSADAAPGLTLELPQLTTAMVGTAVAARPNLPAPIIAAPAPVQTPIQTPMAAAATLAANPTAVPGTRPPRPLANRQREAEKDAARDQAGAPAQ
jgi:general secretion pathway protein C